MTDRLTPEPRLRPATDADWPLLLELYGSTRADELRMLPWPDDQKRAFVEQQFRAQDADYRRRYPDGSFDVVMVGERPAGRLYVARRPREIRVVDISLLVEYRGQGIGGALLRALLEEAHASGRRLSLQVERFNRARRLYERLGLRVVEDGGVYLTMESTPSPS